MFDTTPFLFQLKKHRMTLEDVARGTGLSLRTLRDFAAGRRRSSRKKGFYPLLETVEILMNFFHCSFYGILDYIPA